MLKRISRGYRVASSGAVLALICFFLPWMETSCDPKPYTGLQLAADAPFLTRGEPRLFVLPAACVVVLVLAWRSARKGRLQALDGYVTAGAGTLALGVVAIQVIVFLDNPGAGGLEPGFWGAIIGAGVVACGGVINILDEHRGRGQVRREQTELSCGAEPRARSPAKDEDGPPGETQN